MRFLLSSILLIAAFLAAPAVRAQSIIENGNFDHPTEPFKGWVTDYAFTGNSWYVGNKQHLSIVQEAGRKNVVQFGNAGDAGVKMECRAFPLEPSLPSANRQPPRRRILLRDPTSRSAIA